MATINGKYRLTHCPLALDLTKSIIHFVRRFRRLPYMYSMYEARQTKTGASGKESAMDTE